MSQIKLSGFVALVLMSGSLWSAERPNVLLIMADDFGYECLSCNGSLDYKTPELDRLASEGARFEHFHSQPICTPTRVKLMTGLSNKRNYVRFGRLARDQKTFGHYFQAAGYKTCIAGKWQLGRERDSPQHFGFEESLLWQQTRGRSVDGFDSRYSNPRLERNGIEVDYNDGEFSSDLFSEFLMDFVSDNRKQPFFAYYPMALTHCPFIPTPDSDDWDPNSRGSKEYKGKPKYFAEMVSYVDKTIGKLDAHLRKLGLREQTLLIFIGDNGTDHPIVTNTSFGKVVGEKGSMTDGGNRVPCIVSWPGTIKPGQTVPFISDVSDVLPTICEAAGISLPEETPFDGHSFLPQLSGTSHEPHRESMFMWYARNGGPKAQVFARTADYKLYQTGKYYHVAQDRLEEHDLTIEKLTPEAARVKTLLKATLDQYAQLEYLSFTTKEHTSSKKAKKPKKTAKQK